MTELTIDRSNRTGAVIRWSGPVDEARRLLRTDASICLVGGGALLLSAPAVDALVEAATTGAARVVGAGFGACAVAFWLMGRLRPALLRPAVWFVAVSNIGWLLATMILLASGTLTALGSAIAVVAAVPVALLARAEIAAAREVGERITRLVALTAGADPHA